MTSTPAGNGSPHSLSDAQRMRGIVALVASTTVGLIGQFMLSPLLVFILQSRGLPASQIGLFSATVWLGILVMTPQAVRVVAATGKRAALIISVVVPCVTISGIASTESLWVWTPLYFIAGMAVSLRWVVAEACIAELAPPARRGFIVGLYQTLLGASFVIAPLLLAWLGPLEPATPWLALISPVIGLLLTLAIPALAPIPKNSDSVGYGGLINAARVMPLAVVAGVVGGFFEFGIATLLPVYGLAIGLGTVGAALLLSASGLGSSLVMLPLGVSADRFGATRVMKACALAALLATLLLPAVAWSPAIAWPLAFVWGGAGGALYTLAMIEIGHRHQGGQLIAATSLLVVCYTAGSMVGPIVSGLAIEVSVDYAVPGVFAIIALAGWWVIGSASRASD